MDEEEQTHLLGHSLEDLAAVKVFPLIQSLKKDVMSSVDSALSWDQLTAADINFAIVRPLVFKYAKLDNLAVVYACLVVRSHFLSQAAADLAYSGVSISRANLCEILAMKLLARFASDQIRLVAALSASWSPLAGAPPEIVNEVREQMGHEQHEPQSALEMAIATEAKAFLSSPVVQSVINDIYAGRIVFSLTSNRSVLADNYKPRSIEVYDARKAPFLDHYRLRVPRYGAILEFLNFAILLLLFVLTLANMDSHQMTPVEIIFIIFAAAFALEEYTASKEHGWGIYIANMWNVFDTAFVIVFLAYVGLRIRGVVYDHVASSNLAFDILACGACILFPRLAFFVVSNNVVVLALRAMIADFIFFIGIACICFSGLLFTLHSLAAGTWSVKAIAWLMVQVWFGNTYLSFAQAESFHPIFGPILMTGFAALSNTLLLTILIAILSNTFARIDANATQEYLFQYAISTIEGVKSDALFSYQPPFNLFAFLILWPLSFVLTPRALHSTNVFLIRLTSFPTLVIIGIYERYIAQGQFRKESGPDSLYGSLSRKMKNMPILEHIVGTGASDLYDAIFDVDLSQSQGYELFEDSDEEQQHSNHAPALRSVYSRDSLRPPSITISRPSSSPPSTPRRSRPTSQPPYSPSSPQLSPTKGRREGVSPNGSPRQRRGQPNQGTAEIPALGARSPLSRLFIGREPAVSAEVGVKRIEALVEDIKHLPVNKLKDEMRELQDRQARIENLLLMLTRGMRNETSHHGSVRHETL